MVSHVRDSVAADANIIFGATLNDALGTDMQVSVIVTGLNEAAVQVPGHSPLLAAAQKQKEKDAEDEREQEQQNGGGGFFAMLKRNW